MLPFITIGDFKIQIIYLFIIIFFIVFLFVFWMQSKRDLKNSVLFDIAFVSFFSSIFVSRLLGMLNNLGEYKNLDWNFLPVSIEQEQFVFLKNNPWTFFNLNDGNFLYVGLFFGLILGVIILYLNSNQKKSIYLLFERLLIAYCVAGISILLGMLLQGINIGVVVTEGILKIIYPDGVGRYPLQLLEIIFLIIFLVYRFGRNKIFKRTELSPRAIVLQFFVFFGLSEFLVQPYSEKYTKDFLNTIDLTQLIALSIIFVGVVLALSNFWAQKRSQQIKLQGGQHITSGRTRLLNRNYGNIEAVNKYNLSYTKRKVK